MANATTSITIGNSSIPITITGSNIITAGGNVGINSTVPSATLDVAGDIYVASNITNATNIITNNLTGNLSATQPNLTTLESVTTLGNAAIGAITMGSTSKTLTLNSTVTNLGNKVGISSSTPALNLDVTGGIYISGNLGINSSVTSEILDITGNALISANLTAGNITTTNITGNASASQPNITTLQSVTTLGNAATGAVVVGNTSSLTTIQGTQLNNANGNVGIGSASPTQKLDVSGNVNVSGNIQSGNLTTTNITATLQTVSQPNVTTLANVTSLATNTSSAINIGSTTKTITLTGSTINTTSSKVGIGSVSPSQDLDVTGIIYTSSNIGIGSASPSQKLDVAGDIYVSSNIAGVNSIVTNNLTGNLSATQPNITTLVSATTVGNAATGAITMGVATRNNTLQSTSTVLTVSGNVGFSSSSPIQKADIAGSVYVSGVLGIGSVSPSQQLDVIGNVNVTSNVTTPNSLTVTNVTGTITSTSSSQPNLITVANITTAGNASTSAITIGNSTPVTTLTGSKIVLSGGNVGVGSASPVQKLDVSGSIYTPNNIGIGSAAPSQSLDVSGNINASGNVIVQNNVTATNLTGTVVFDNLSNVTSMAGLTTAGNTASSTVTIGNQTQLLILQTNKLFATTGSVGIGSASPSQKLDVAGDMNASGNITAGNISTANYVTGKLLTASQPNLTTLANVTTLGTTVTSGVTAGITSQTLTLQGSSFNLTSGNVGIGSASPSQKLDVSGAINVTGNIQAGNTTVTNATGTLLTVSQPNVTTLQSVTTLGNAVSGPITVGSTTRNITIQTSNIAINTVTSVGIGSATPSQLLDVTGNINASGNVIVQNNVTATNLTGTVAFNNLSNVTSMAGLTTAGNTAASTVTVGNVNQPLILQTNKLFATTGNVGIGSALPSQKLDVAGSVYASGNITAGNISTANYVTGTLLTSSQPNLTTLANVTSLGTTVTSGVTAGITSQTLTLQGNSFNLTSGNVGIGSASPSQKLDVAGNINIIGNITAGNISTNNYITGNLLTASQPGIGTLANATIVGTTVNSAINIGTSTQNINTTTSALNETIGTSVFKVTGSNILLSANSTGIITYASNIINNRVSNTLVSYVRSNITSPGAYTYTSNTNVGVGTTNPQSILHVQGDMMVTGQFLDTNSLDMAKWYVFNSSNVCNSNLSGVPTTYNMSSPFGFSNANTNDSSGPSQATLISYYNTKYPSDTWVNNTSYFTATSGIQYWTVPATGTYVIIAAGAAGSGAANSVGGRGVVISTTYNLTMGQQIKILVGQMPPPNANWQGGGGGGGTFVATLNNIPILVAGGGGGGGGNGSGNGVNINGFDAVATKTGTYTGTTAGGAGVTGNCGGAGAGFNTNGSPANYFTSSTTGAYSFVNGGVGGYAGPGGEKDDGGFGGGGGSTNGGGAGGAGGGGGYTGGNAEANFNGTNPFAFPAGAGGGSYDINGSANNATLYTGLAGYSSGYNTGGGFVIITSPVGATTLYNIGIGTTSPSKPLHLQGDMLITGGSNYDSFNMLGRWYQNNTINTFASYLSPINALYQLSNPFGFSNANTNGISGPSQATLITYYNTQYPSDTWVNNTSYFTATAGIQYWTVPVTGTYRLVAAGAAGANGSVSTTGGGGSGVIVSNTVSLTAGQQIKILVGQRGISYLQNGPSCGGGGGTFITTSTNSPILVAGGGGGSIGTVNTSVCNGQLTTSGASTTVSGGTGGNAGDGTTAATGGAGFTGNGTGTPADWGSVFGFTIPYAFVNGGTGSSAGSFGGQGGFGGGGASGNGGGNTGSGGGGGYSGGAGGNQSASAGGGGSYDSTNSAGSYAATLYTALSGYSSGYNPGDGFVIITSPSNTIQVNYNVGIGTSIPSQIFDLYGNISMRGNVLIGTNKILYSSNINSTGNLVIANSTGTITGNVGVSTTLTNYGNITTSNYVKILSPITYTGFTTNQSAGVTINNLWFGPGISITQSGANNNVADFYQTTINNTTPALRVAYTGNVGIYTGTPAYPLEVIGNICGTTITTPGTISVGGSGTSIGVSSSTYSMSPNFGFSNANTAGPNGPSQATLITYYNTQYPSDTWVNNTAYFTATSGIQYWTVPFTGSYQIIAAGAGNNLSGYGKGIIVSTTVSLTAGQIIKILVGQQPTYYRAGAGGSFVTYNNNTAILVAGGAGGGGTTSTTNTTAIAPTYGGTTGASGQGGNASGNASGGGGFNTNGVAGGGNQPGIAYVNGGYGNSDGGFGGGAGSFNAATAGGGGGYSGGNSDNNYNSGGGGGSSYDINGTNNNATIYTGLVGYSSGYNTGSGFVVINNVTSGYTVYTMSSQFSFSNANTTGPTGPSQATLISNYNTQYPSDTWVNNTSYFTATSGIQYWTVPATATYRLIAAGAANGTNMASNGRGVIVSNLVNLTIGQKIKILVGQRPSASICGGGGTFITTSANAPLLVAGGGGGQSSSQNVLAGNGQLTTSGQNTNNSSGTIYGGSNGGAGGSYTGFGNNVGGAGFYTNSVSGSITIYSYVNGGQSYTNCAFGCGGYGDGNAMGGGGGGYSGGAAGGDNYSVFANGSGGGGGSYDSTNSGGSYNATLYTGLAGYSSGYNTGDGFVIITNTSIIGPSSISGNLSASNVFTTGLVSCTGNISTSNNLFASNISSLNGSWNSNVTCANALPTIITSTGNLSAGNITVSGTATFSNGVTGNVNTGAQPNITSVGTLTGLTVTNTASGGTLSTTNVTAVNVNGPNPNTCNVIYNNGTPIIQQQTNSAGLFFKAITSGYFSDVPTYFVNTAANATGYGINFTNIATATNNIVAVNQTPVSVEWFGYFYASSTGTYSFTIGSDDASYLWLGTNALSGYTTANANLNNGGIHGFTTTAAYTTSLTSNTYTPIRMQYGNSSGNGDFAFTFTPPGGSATNSGSGYLYTFANNTVITSVPVSIINAVGITASGNITTSHNINATTNLTATGNINTPNYLTSGSHFVSSTAVMDGSRNFTNIVNTTASGLLNLTSNLSASGLTTATGNISGPNLISNNIVSSTGNLSGANFSTGGLVSATGNISGANIVANTGLYGTIASANASQTNITSVGTLTSFTGVSGNLTPASINILTNGSNLNVTGNVIGANIVTTGNTVTGGTVVIDSSRNFTVGTISASGNVSTSINLSVTGVLSSTGNLSAANFSTGGLVSATGNISGANIVANTGLYGTIASANASQTNITSVGTLTSFTGVSGNLTPASINILTNGSNLNVTGNVIGANIVTTGNTVTGGTVVIDSSRNFTVGTISASGNVSTSTNLSVTGVLSSTGNLSGGNLSTGGLVSATGNITGANIIGALYGTLMTAAQPNITSVGTITSLPGITGNLTPANINVLTSGYTLNTTGNVIGGNIVTSGNTYTGGTVVIDSSRNFTVGTISASGTVTTSANVSTTGIISTSTGNVSGANVIGPLYGTIPSANASQPNITTLTGATTISATGTTLSIQGVSNPILVGGILPLSDDFSTLTTSNKTVIRAPYAFNIRTTKLPLFSLITLPTSTTATQFDITVGGTSIYSAKPTISSSATNSTTAGGGTGTVTGTLTGNISVSAGSIISISVFTVGSGTPAGAKCVIYAS